jgi:magnesium chelatase family protein
LEIAAAGGHNVLMIGPPGSGKTMLAKRLPSILSAMTTVEALETTKIHSVAGFLRGRARLLETRPFRDPHHTISNVAMVGGGAHPKPGEVSLSHHGVLFLDELAEFRRDVLEVLRQPIEEGQVSIARAATTLTFPSRFMLVAAMNPCPCGYYTDPKKECQCSSLQIRSYLSKISGPLLDRIDIQLEVPRLRSNDMFAPPGGETSEEIRLRVEKARNRQYGRYGAGMMNAALGPAQIEEACRLDAEGLSLIKQAVDRMGFSTRAYHKTLKVARTIADLEAEEAILPRHVAEAVHYRVLDRACA